MPVPGGDRSGGGAASRVPSIPRCGVSSPFRGHLSTKSNAFCIGHSSRLSDQYRIRDHMLAHYNKVLTAKAAVDCSAPKSLTKSIKYNDQQRRERLRTAVTRIERNSLPSRASSSRPDSRESLDSALQQKDLYDGFAACRSPYSDPGVSPASLISSSRHFHSSDRTADFSRRRLNLSGAPSRLGCGQSGGSSSSSWGGATCRFRDNREKAYSGDLIERHAQHFTSTQRPFTPRTLRTAAKSVLVQSRFYTPPRRRKGEAVSEAEVQTDVSSFRSRRTANREPSLDREQVEETENSLLSEEDDDTKRHHLSTSRMSYNELKSPSPSLQRIHSEEEELAYLGFVADVTNEILSLGLFSDRILDQVFERHLEENRHHLDEGKMHHLLDVLRADLDSKDKNQLELFPDHNFSTSRRFRDPFVLPLTTDKNCFHSKDHSTDQSSRRYLNGDGDEPQPQDGDQTGLDGEDNLGRRTYLTCLGGRSLEHSQVLSDKEDAEGTQRSPEAAISLPEEELDTSHGKYGLLRLEDDHEKTSQDNSWLSEKMSPVDNVLQDDYNEKWKSSSGMYPTTLQEVDNGLRISHEPRDLEDLEQNFSEIIQVSKAEGGPVHEEETENIPIEREDISDQDDF